MSASDPLYRIVAALDEVGIPYMLTGSYASSYYGTPRATQDIDFVVAPTSESLSRLVRLLPDAEYVADPDQAAEALRTRGQFNIIELESGWKIDLILRKEREFSRTEFARRRPVEIGGATIVVASAEDVILAKLEWAKLGSSERQIRDVAGILRVQEARVDREYVGLWVLGLGLAAEWRAARQMAGEATP